MRELMLCLEAHKKKFYHLGFGTTVTRRNFGRLHDIHQNGSFFVTPAKDIAMLYKNHWRV